MTLPTIHLNEEQAKALHSLQDFAGLLSDPRFASSLIYLRANFPNKSAATGDEWRGWYSAIDALEHLLRHPPQAKPDKDRPKTVPYATTLPDDRNPPKQ